MVRNRASQESAWIGAAADPTRRGATRAVCGLADFFGHFLVISWEVTAVFRFPRRSEQILASGLQTQPTLSGRGRVPLVRHRMGLRSRSTEIVMQYRVLGFAFAALALVMLL